MIKFGCIMVWLLLLNKPLSLIKMHKNALIRIIVQNPKPSQSHPIRSKPITSISKPKKILPPPLTYHHRTHHLMSIRCIKLIGLPKWTVIDVAGAICELNDELWG